VALVPSGQERWVALRTVIAEEPEPLVTLTHLLRLCRDEHGLLWERVSEPSCQARAAQVVSTLDAVLASQPARSVLGPDVRRLLAAALVPAGDVPVVVLAHAMAGFIDQRYGDSFAASFRRRSPYQPAVGDPVPLDSPDLRTITALRPTSPPWRLANRLDETRRVRLAGEWTVQFRLVFDYGLADILTDLVTADTVVATCHPNRRLADFDQIHTAGGTFPVRPADPDRQQAEIDRLLDRATAAGASIVVLPELSVTETLAAHLQDWVRRPGPLRLLVAGSYHHEDHDGPGHGTGRHGDQEIESRRRNTAVSWVRGYPEPLLQDKHSPGDRPICEDIQPQAWPQVRVYVTADGWHIAIAICRDLLNPQAVYALAEAGVNLVLVPAMSETLMPFGGPVAQLVGSRQALVAVANNPAEWSHDVSHGAGRPARALFGHPGFGQQTRFVHGTDTTAGVAVLTVGSAQLGWLPANQPTLRPAPPDADTQLGPDRAPPAARPPWVPPLTVATTSPDPTDNPAWPTSWRPAAVLVLLTDGPTGPRVLLTERAPDLADYPGRLSFPGGHLEPDDDGPAGAALREAAEEVGLDPDSIDVLGLLPTLALPDTGFLVTPVLAWSARPRYPEAVNLAEVTAVWTIPLRDLRNRFQPADRLDNLAAEMPGPDLRALGSMTATVIDLLLGILSRCEDTTDFTAAGAPDAADPS
jgi:8-oxo-dGTP pyrophosphatase MutT (NUDIX family)